MAIGVAVIARIITPNPRGGCDECYEIAWLGHDLEPLPLVCRVHIADRGARHAKAKHDASAEQRDERQ